MEHKPIKRHEALQNLSREHHEILTFGLRLKKGIQKEANLKIMNAYIDWFWESYLESHFQLEENQLFPLYKDSNLILQAESQHQELEVYFQKKNRNVAEIKLMYLLLEKHIRFEERTLFNKIQNELSAKELKHFEEKHLTQQVCPFWKDSFWKE